MIGESTNYRGEDNPIMEAIHTVKKKLEDILSLPVYLEQEFLTSAEARRIPQNADEARSRKLVKKKEIDAEAAALILQSYLDKTKN